MKQLAPVLRDLATLLDLGFALPEALQRLREGCPPELASFCQQAEQRVNAGTPLGQVFQGNDFFPPFLVHTLEQGEGDPAQALRLAARLVEEREQRLAEIRRALAYPRTILIVLVIFVAVLIYLIVPLFEGLMASFSLQLPLPTQILLALSRSPLAGLGCLAVVAAPLLVLSAWEPADAIRLNLPFLGNWLTRQQALLWLRWVGALLERGVPLSQAAALAGQACSSARFQASMKEVADSLNQGGGLGSALERQALFPQLAAWMVGQAEKREFPDGDLERVARAVQLELDRSFERGIPFLEPLLMLAMGMLVSCVVASIFLPLYQLIGNLG